MEKKRGKTLLGILIGNSILTLILVIILVSGVVQSFTNVNPIAGDKYEDIPIHSWFHTGYPTRGYSGGFSQFWTFDDYKITQSWMPDGVNYIITKAGTEVFNDVNNRDAKYKLNYNDKGIDFSVYECITGGYYYSDGKWACFAMDGSNHYLSIKPSFTIGGSIIYPKVASGWQPLDVADTDNKVASNQYQGISSNIITGYYFDDAQTGTNIVKISYTNSVGHDITAKLIAYVERTDPFSGTVYYDDYSTDVILKYGGDTLQVVLKDYPFGSYKFNSQLILPIKDYAGSIVGYFPLTQLKQKLFLINPKRLALQLLEGQPLPEGYVFQQESDSSTGSVTSGNCNNANRCVIFSDTISELPCIQVGCPVVVGYTYSCQSDGLCSEFIAQPFNCKSDIECGLGKTCEVETGICIKTELITYLQQCEIASDCPNYCGSNTVSINCLNVPTIDHPEGEMQCIPDGTCTITLEPLNCNTASQSDKDKKIAEGYTCSSDGYWERTITDTVTSIEVIKEIKTITTTTTVTKDCTNSECPPNNKCDTNLKVCVSEKQVDLTPPKTKLGSILRWTLLISIILNILLGIAYFISRKKK